MGFQGMVSVIVPIYNAEKYVKKCVRSILVQTYQNLEIILVDDGSTDRSSQICEKLSKEDNRIRIFHKENAGVSSARNYGLQKSKGEYISFVDADDYITRDYINTLIRDMEKVGTDIVQCGFYELYPNGKIKKKGVKKSHIIKLNKNFNHCKNNEAGFIGGKLFRKEILKGIYFDTGITMSEDALFMAEVMRKNDAMYYEKENLYIYRIHMESAVHSIKEAPDASVLDARRKIFRMQEIGSVAYFSAGIRYLEICRRFATELKNSKNTDDGKIYNLQLEIKKNLYIIWRAKENIVQKFLLLLFLYMPDIYFCIFNKKKELDMKKIKK